MKIDHWENPCVVLCGMNTSWKRAYFHKVLRSLPRELWTRTSSFVKNKEFFGLPLSVLIVLESISKL
jgi:hypothetical protein